MTLSQPLDEMKRGPSRLHETPRYKYESLGINMNPIKMGVGAIIVALLLISVTGCTGSQNTTQSVSTNQGQSTTQAISVTIMPMGTAMQIGRYNTPEAGNVFVQYTVTVKDNNVPQLEVSPNYFGLQSSNNVIYKPDFATYSIDIHGFEMAKLVPNGAQSGIIVFQIPQGVKPVAVIYDDYSHKVTTTL